MKNPSEYLKFAINIAKKAGKIQMSYFGNISSLEKKSTNIDLGGKLIGNINSDRIKIKSTAEVEGVLNQKTLSIEEGASLKIKTETHK